MSKLAHGEALQGFACRYNRVWVDPDLPGGYGVLARGCFERSLRNQEVRFLLGHNASSCMGSTASSLVLHDSDDGLAFRFLCPPMPVRDAIAAGNFRSMSIGFDYDRTEQAAIGGETISIVREAALKEISLVDRPAISNTSIALVRLADVGTLRQEIAAGNLSRDGAYSQVMNAADDFRRLVSTMVPSKTVAAPRATRRRPPLIDFTHARANSLWFQPGAREFFADVVAASGETPGGLAQAMWKHGRYAANVLPRSRAATRPDPADQKTSSDDRPGRIARFEPGG